MDIKNNIVSNQHNVKYFDCLSDILILYLLMLMCVFAAIGSFIQGKTAIAIEALVLGFLLSPYGIPMIGAAIIAFIQGINEAIKIL